MESDSSVAESGRRVQRVIEAMLGMQRASWEQGVAAQSLLEWHRSEGKSDFLSNIPLLSMCHDAVTRQDQSTGRLSVLLNQADSGSLDPASIIEPLLTVSKSLKNKAFEDAARKQIDFLLKSAPRTANGILSHRIDKVQLWVDGIYMGPPALAYASIHWTDKSLILEAVKQIEGYRHILWNKESQLYSHIWDDASQSFERKAFWGVGNGWALAGITRVLLLLPEEMVKEREVLLGFVKEGLDGVLNLKRPDHLFHDVLDDPSSFVETNVGQQVAYTIFRLAEHGLVGEKYVETAELIRETVHTKVDSYGLLRGVCGSPTFDRSGTATEGQAFFILMEAAYRDYKRGEHART